MYYITAKRDLRRGCQMTFEEMLFQTFKLPARSWKESDTITIRREYLDNRYIVSANVPYLISRLTKFVTDHAGLYEVDRRSLYYSFKIPKKTGGYRQIDAPESELSDALIELREIFQKDFRALYHTSAWAYIERRSTVDCVKRHQENKSRWFAKLDLHNFFGSTTPDFVMQQLSMVYPFCAVMQYREGVDILRKALDLCFLDGVLPQGTQISPLLTNIMMIPIDFELSKAFRESDQRFIYTRYADDFIISSRYDFDVNEVADTVKSTLKKFNAPFTLNDKKTRYGSSSGSNWNLGVVLTKDNKITVGYKNKKNMQCAMANLVRDHNNGVRWSLGDLQHLQGIHSYYDMVEHDTIKAMVDHLGEKLGADILGILRSEIKNYSSSSMPQQPHAELPDTLDMYLAFTDFD